MGVREIIEEIGRYKSIRDLNLHAEEITEENTIIDKMCYKRIKALEEQIKEMTDERNGKEDARVYV